MINQLERQGSLQSLVNQACEESESLQSDVGRGGARGFFAFHKLRQKGEKVEEQQRPSFTKSLNARLSASENVASALEENLARRFPAQLSWNRKAVSGPAAKTVANRMTFVVGEILRLFGK